MERDRQEDAITPEIVEASGGGRKKWLIAGGAVVLAVAGIGAAGAMSGGDGMRRYIMNAGMHHGGHFAGRGLGRVLDSIDATAEQEERIWTIIDDARAELRPMMRDFRDARESLVEILVASSIDRDAAETLRAERIAAIDEASKKMTAAALEAAAVLTPEQRATLAERFQERGWGRR